MELLEEYQNALKKIETLEDKLKVYKDTVETVAQGLKAVSNMFKMHADALNDGETDPRLKHITDELFNEPHKLCEMLTDILRMPEMSEHEREQAKRAVAMRGLAMVRDRLSRYVEDEE